MLSVVSTPIGNLEDITFRAVRTLKEADVVVCEDTRTSRVLFDRYQIAPKRVDSFHGHSSPEKAAALARVAAESHVALISDAGTPGISDPGFVLIQECIKAGVKVVPVPGVSAAVTAASCSGLHVHHFLYLGFLPLKKGRHTLFTSLKEKEYPVVIYESVHRLESTLEDIQDHFGAEHPVVVARELTKMFEEFVRLPVSEARAHFKAKKPKGEFVILF